MMQRLLLAALGAGLVAGIGLAHLGLGDRAPGGTFSWEAADNVTPPIACDLNRGPCLVPLPGDAGSLVVETSPSPAHAMTTFSVAVTVAGDAAVPVELLLEGRDMTMGRHRHELTADGDAYAAQEVMLPLCTTRTMVWNVAIALEGPAGPLRVALPMTVSNP